MNENSKILVLAALVLVVAIVSFNLNITGKVGAEGKTMITVPSKVVFERSGGSIVNAARVVNVAFKNIGSEGLDSHVDLRYADDDTIAVSRIMTICNRATCEDDVVRPLKISAGLASSKQGEVVEYYLQAQNKVGFNKPEIVVKSNTFTVE